MTASTRSLLAWALLTCCLAPGSLLAQDAPVKPQPAVNESLHAPIKVRVAAGKTEVPARFLVEAWGMATKRRVGYSQTVSPAIRLTLSAGVHELSRTELLTMLERADVTVLESERDLYALHTRELQGKIQVQNQQTFTGDAPLPQLNRPITWTCEIKNGAGSAIYANLRGILARDPSRAGNILYIQGPEKLIVTDLAPKVSYYRDLIRQLDRPVGAQLVTLYRAPAKLWDTLKTKPSAEIAKALAADPKQAVRLEEVRATGADLTLKQNVEVGGRVMLIKLDMLTTQNAAHRHSPFRIKTSITEHAEGGSYQAEIDFVSPRSGPGSVTSVSFQGGQERLIVVVTPLS
jgi:hypothetical protein